jgi:2-oxoisovalerate dehydrogenase E1 component beta subunit
MDRRSSKVVAMRMCGHAHHDDMLYLGKDPQPSWQYAPLTPQGYANPKLYEFWSARDPIATYAERLLEMGVIEAGTLALWRDEAEALVEEEARAVVAAPWPDPSTVGEGVIEHDPRPRTRVEVLDRDADGPATTPALEVEVAPPFDKKGMTFLDAVMHGVGDALAADPRVFVFGQDVGGSYGNAFLLLRPLLDKFGDRILNSPLAEGAVLGGCIGAALAGCGPSARCSSTTSWRQASISSSTTPQRFAIGGASVCPWSCACRGVACVMPDRTTRRTRSRGSTAHPGLKIAVPSTPFDARALMASAVADPDPVLYYEHIALYRDPRIKQQIDPATAPAALPVGKAALRRAGDDLAIISYGAYVHVAMRVADALANDGIQASVLDLRWLAPLDRDAVLAVVKRTGRALVVHEDSRTGGIGESLAAIIQEEAFEWLDAPVRVMGALDTPVPYSPPLEDAFLPSEADVERAARLLVKY